MASGGGSAEKLDKTVITVIDEQIARISDITRRQDQTIAKLTERLLEMTV